MHSLTSLARAITASPLLTWQELKLLTKDTAETNYFTVFLAVKIVTILH